MSSPYFFGGTIDCNLANMLIHNPNKTLSSYDNQILKYHLNQ